VRFTKKLRLDADTPRGDFSLGFLKLARHNVQFKIDWDINVKSHSCKTHYSNLNKYILTLFRVKHTSSFNVYFLYQKCIFDYLNLSFGILILTQQLIRLVPLNVLKGNKLYCRNRWILEDSYYILQFKRLLYPHMLSCLTNA